MAPAVSGKESVTRDDSNGKGKSSVCEVVVILLMRLGVGQIFESIFGKTNAFNRIILGIFGLRAMLFSPG